MDLLKYLEPMKNVPERFSNLAFWRGVRKLKDEVVSAFEYVDSWGKSIESKENELENLINSKNGFELLKTINLNINMFSTTPIKGSYFLQINQPPNIPDIPDTSKFAIVYANFTIQTNSAAYDCRALWSTPIMNSHLIYPQNYAISRTIINIDSEYTVSLAQGACWCYG